MADEEYTSQHHLVGNFETNKEKLDDYNFNWGFQKQECNNNIQHLQYEGLEIAMKQLIEVTQNALMNMKAEISTMQCDIEKALADINSIKKHDEALHNEWRSRTVQFEREFMGLVDELRQSMMLELNHCRQEIEDSMIEKMESILISTIPTQKENESTSLKQKTRIVKRHDVRSTSNFNCINDGGQNYEMLRSYDKSNNETFIEMQNKLVSDELIPLKNEENVEYHPKSEQRAGLTEEMLQRVSSHRLERSAAAVRGWLQSPTPSEEGSHGDTVARQFQQTPPKVPPPNSGTSFKEELHLRHRHARSLPHSRAHNDKGSPAIHSMDTKRAST